MSNSPLLTWTSHPFKEFVITSILLSVFMVVLGIGLWYLTVTLWDMPIFYYIGVLVFFFSLISYFIPTRYELYDTKIIIFYWIIKTERHYSDFKCYYSDKKGVMLSTFNRPRRLDPFRGLSLRFTRRADEKIELFKILDQKVGKSY